MRSAARQKNQTIDLIGFPMDLGADRRGVDMGPSALRIAGVVERLRALGYRVTDRGDVAVRSRERQKITDPRLKYIAEIVRASGVLARRVRQSLDRGGFPLCAGGDHSMALGTVAGIADHCRRSGKVPGVVWIDAHTDMNTARTTPSGNIHGMPLAASLGVGPDRLTRLLGFGPKLRPENCALLGVRSIDRLEKETIRGLDLPVYTMADIDRRGAGPVIDEVLARVTRRVDHLHVSFDIDSVDPSVAAGVGTPVAGGLTYREAHLIMESLAACGCLRSLEVAELNPILDRRNLSAEFAAELVASCMGQRIL